MNPAAVEWLKVNKLTLIESNQKVPTLWMTDFLIRHGIYTPADDDYQHIRAQCLGSNQLRALLESLPDKGPNAIAVFRGGLEKFCPKVLSVCCDPPHSGAAGKVSDYSSTVDVWQIKGRMSTTTELRSINSVNALYSHT